jgi:TolB-like protein
MAEFANRVDGFDSMNGVVMGKSLLINRPTSEEEGISEEAVREELSRILESSMFIQSDRLSRFLRFTIEATLAGEAEMLKEYLIGTEVYDRKPPYHPNMDSIVRSEARRLRNKLKEYYESVGKDDPVFIYYRLGSYAPVFRPNRRHDGNDNLKDNGRSELFIEGRGIRTAVLPFLDASRGDVSGACAQIITDELIHEIGRTEGFRVSAASSMAPLVAQDLDLPSVARKLDVQIVFEGSVREDNNQLHVTSRVVNAEGFLIWSERFETEPDIQSLFKVSERIASSLISRVRPEKSSIRKQKVKKASYRLRSSENSRSDRIRLSSRR